MKRYKVENIMKYNEKANILNLWIHIQVNRRQYIIPTSFNLNDYSITINVIKTFINLYYKAMEDGENWEECEKLINDIPNKIDIMFGRM